MCHAVPGTAWHMPCTVRKSSRRLLIVPAVSLFASNTLTENLPLVVVAVERAVDRSPDGLTYALPQSLAHLPEGARVEFVVMAGPGGRWEADAIAPAEG